MVDDVMSVSPLPFKLAIKRSFDYKQNIFSFHEQKKQNANQPDQLR